MKKYKVILTGALIGLIAFPTIIFGGSLVSSLIHGKTAGEAIHILAQQIDSLTGRVGALESKENEETCDKLDYFENRIQYLKNTISDIEGKRASFIENCSPYWKDISQECRDAYENLPTDEFPAVCYGPYRNIPPNCAQYDHEIQNDGNAIAGYQKQISELSSNADYLQAKEQCVR
ncbi:MAG: hypothetical protein WC514_01145 [Candidatus Paceibacterota bacterium]